MKNIFILFIFLVSNYSLSQINQKDSTFQAIGYWDLNEEQQYKITHSKYKVTGNDSILKSKVDYTLNIKITDSTANSYTIEWQYSDFKTNVKHPLLSKIISVNENRKIIFKTDEMGAFREILNLEELTRDYQKTLDILKKEISKSDNELVELTKKIETLYTGKLAVNSTTTKDINQFYNFHGGAYKLNEVLEGDLKVDNLLGGEPFDAKVYVELTEISEDNDFVVLLLEQYVDQEQLAKEAIRFGEKIIDKKISAKDKKDIEKLEHSIILTSSIHNTGWPLYSMQVTNVSLDGNSSVEIREIEIILDEN